jgi:hypothetical protein
VQPLAEPSRLYCPGGHGVAVALTLPAGQLYPAAHGPVHADVVKPDICPKRPAAQGPEHAADTSLTLAPYRPTLQLVHRAAPATL